MGDLDGFVQLVVCRQGAIIRGFGTFKCKVRVQLDHGVATLDCFVRIDLDFVVSLSSGRGVQNRYENEESDDAAGEAKGHDWFSVLMRQDNPGAAADQIARYMTTLVREEKQGRSCLPERPWNCSLRV